MKKESMIDDHGISDAASDNLLEKCLKNIQGEITSLTLNLNEEQSRRIRELEADLRQARSVVDFFQSKLESAKNDYAKEKAELIEEITRAKEQHAERMQILQSLDRRAVCLIDGDGTIFSLAQVAKGQAGGRDSAAKLTESIRKQLPPDPCHLHVWVFLNKGGLLETLRKCGKEEARRNFEDFIRGFNQAADRFMVVDVGGGKEAVDSKIKAHLEDEVKSLQTIKVIFGGCHDNGYLTTIRSLVTAGHASKLVLLQGYTEMAAGFYTLGLPSLKINDLFEPDKLCPAIPNSPTISAVSSSMASGLNRERSNSSPFISLPSTSGPVTPRTPLHPAPSLQGIVWRSAVTSSPPRSRHIDPTKPLSKQEPPPCNVFYLTTGKGCKFGASCAFAHDYLLTAEHIETMRENAKKSPCATLIRGESCPYADSCCYGHKCPFGSKCHFYKMSMCKFAAVGMHAD